MLKICSKALLLSNVPSFVKYISDISADLGIELDTADVWNINYRLNAEVIICGSKYIPYINVIDYDKVRLILKTNETVAEFIEMGITHFIFDYNNTKEVAFSFFFDAEEKQTDEMTVTDIINKTKISRFTKGKYDFNFLTNTFKYDGVGIYLRESEKIYIAKWLFLNIKENSKRILLFNMRKKFGKDFMQDIDRLGKIKEE